MVYSIYVIEDDKNISELLEIAFKTYSYKVFLFENAEEVIKNLDKHEPDLIVCDIMLPGIDGIQAISKIRSYEQFKSIPIILLTAKDSELEKIKGLDAGADDYIVKPFSIMELMARIRAQFRKMENTRVKLSKHEEKSEIILGDIKINTFSREVFIKEKIVEFTFKEYEILKYLLENVNKPISREEILNKIWGYEYLGETRTIDIHIKSIRKKMSSTEEYIKTIRGIGYKISL